MSEPSVRRACARRLRSSCGRRPPRSARLSASCGAAARSIPPPWNSASPPGSAATSPSRASQQEAELQALRAEMPEYASIPSPILPDVLARLDQTYQAFFRRLANGEKPGFPRFQGKDRYHSFTDKAVGTGARLENG